MLAISNDSGIYFLNKAYFKYFKGFIKNFAVYLMGKKLEFYLISRKSCKKAGTRYNARGNFT